MARSGQITVGTAGIAVQGPDQRAGLVAFKSHPDNTGVTWLGSDGAGDVSNANGYPLGAGSGEQVIIHAGNLLAFWFDAEVSGEKICWLTLE